MKSKLIAGAAGVALIAGAGLGLAQTAQADTSSPTPTASASAKSGDTTRANGRHDGHGRGGRGFDAAALATKLGLSEVTVSDAVTAVRDQTDSGTPPASDATQAERDAARDARRAKLAKALATELNIDEAKVTTALTDLQTERMAKQATARTAALAKAVNDGTLTQSEADAVQKAIDAHIIGTHDQAVTDGTLTRSEADAVQKAIDAHIIGTRDGAHGRR